MKKQNSGFTIIEVMIVLAIASLIIATVFLGVQALQRSQRDSKNKEAAGKIIHALEAYASDHGGTYPTDTTPDSLITPYLSGIKAGNGDDPVRVPTANANNLYATNATGDYLKWSTGANCTSAYGVAGQLQTGSAYKNTVGVAYYSLSRGQSSCVDSRGNQF